MVASAPTPTPERLLVTVDEACGLLSIGRTHLYKLHRNGVVDFVKLGGATRIRYSDLVDLSEVSS